MSYKIIFLDIDGTLTNAEKKVTPATKKALFEAQEKGYLVAIASGRPDRGVEGIAREIGLDKFGGFTLSYNGGRVRNFKTGELLVQKSLGSDAFGIVAEFARRNGADVMTYEGDTIICENPDNEFIQIESRINGLPVKKVDNIGEYVDFSVPKCIIAGKGDRMAELEPQLREHLAGKADVFRSEPFFLEIMPYHTDKAVSIGELIKKLGIKREKTIACGDGYNDVSMIKYAGLGVAMENACDAAKEAADFITLSNENDGVANVIERFMKP